MSQMSDYERGKQDGIRWAVTWLHARALEMNDPNANTILNTAALHMSLDRAAALSSAEGR